MLQMLKKEINVVMKAQGLDKTGKAGIGRTRCLVCDQVSLFLVSKRC
jgi:hypothetical protein